MLPKSERLRKAGLFQRVYAAKNKVSTDVVALYVLPKVGQYHIQKRSNKDASEQANANTRPAHKISSKPPLAGFVVAKKVSKSACARNRAKRQLQEAYRLIRKETAQKLGLLHSATERLLSQWYALVFVAHEKILTADWKEIEKSVATCLIKANEKYGKSS